MTFILPPGRKESNVIPFPVCQMQAQERRRQIEERPKTAAKWKPTHVYGAFSTIPIRSLIQREERLLLFYEFCEKTALLKFFFAAILYLHVSHKHCCCRTLVGNRQSKLLISAVERDRQQRLCCTCQFSPCIK